MYLFSNYLIDICWTGEWFRSFSFPLINKFLGMIYVNGSATAALSHLSKYFVITLPWSYSQAWHLQLTMNWPHLIDSTCFSNGGPQNAPQIKFRYAVFPTVLHPCHRLSCLCLCEISPPPTAQHQTPACSVLLHSLAFLFSSTAKIPARFSSLPWCLL